MYELDVEGRRVKGMPLFEWLDRGKDSCIATPMKLRETKIHVWIKSSEESS